MEPLAGEQSTGATVGSSNLPSDDRLLVKWLESQPDSCQTQLAKERLEDFLDKAAQPRHVSGNACTKLCYFIEQCRISKSSHVREVVSSKETCLNLFNFYIEWNEKNQNRSMRRVLELLSSLISISLEEEILGSTKKSILQRLLSIITHQAAQALVKPAFKCLECFLSKGSISSNELIRTYQDQILIIRSRLVTHVEEFPTNSQWDSLISEVFGWMTLPDVSPAAGKFLVTLFRELRRMSTDSDTRGIDHTILWQRWIRRGLSKNPGTLENVKNYLFPPLFKLDRPGSVSFLEDLSKQKPISGLHNEELDAHSLLQLAAIEVGKKSGLVEEPSIINFQKTSKTGLSCIVLEEDSVGALLTHASDTVRSLAFSVLVCSSSSIRPFSPKTLDILKSHMWILYADTDAKFRNDVLSNTKHMIERLRGATAYLGRECGNLSSLSASDQASNFPQQQQNEEALDVTRNLLQSHEAFVEWFLGFLAGELIPTSSYQRHITTLKAIIILLQSGIAGHESLIISNKNADNATVWPYTIEFFTPGMLRLLLDLVMDPFEDVRSSATALLKIAPPNVFADQYLGQSGQFNHRPLDLLMDFISRAKDISKRTGRADYADGLARSYELLYSLLRSSEARIELLEELVDDLGLKIQVAEHDLAQAVSEAPIHGNFAALNFVWNTVDHTNDFQEHLSQEECSISETFNNLQERMVSSCSRIWEAVKDVLCNDSPEGHLPQDIDDIDTIDTKDVLSYSFRAIHESSNLMRTLVGKVKCNWPNGLPLLSTDLFINIGDLTFRQLSTLRHRGAFSTVSLTFATCCQLTQSQSYGTITNSNLLETYTQGAFKCIIEQPSTTRRSAGIPAIVTGILSATVGLPTFREILKKLKSTARESVPLSTTDKMRYPQVHALNCLRDIFKSSSIGSIVEQDIGDCLEIAATCQISHVWPIRNSGVLLLRSIVDRLLGTNENKSTVEAGWDGRAVKLPYDRYPGLPSLLITLLNSGLSVTHSTDKSVESVFPALDIIHRAGVPPSHLDHIRRCVLRHIGNRVWNVREMAARTLSAIIIHDAWVDVTIQLLKGTHETSANHLHGVLMTVKDILQRQRALDIDLAAEGVIALSPYLRRPGHWFSIIEPVPHILAAELELYNTIARIILESNANHQASPGHSNLDAIVRRFFPSDAFEEMENIVYKYNTMCKSSSMNEKCAALVHNGIVRRAILTTSLTNDVASVPRILDASLRINIDVALVTIECLRVTWLNKSSEEELATLATAYIRTIELSQSAEVRRASLYCLGEVLNRTIHQVDLSMIKLLENNDRTQPTSWICLRWGGKVENLALFLDGRGKTPSLTNSEIATSGSMLLYCLYESSRTTDYLQSSITQQILEWGKLMAFSGDSNMEFETRKAAIQALAEFFTPLYKVLKIDIECLLPAYLALYDTLNDDDEEIRNLGAKAVSSILEKQLAPLPAQNDFIVFLNNKYSRSTLWAWNIICRISGNNYQIFERNQAKLHPAKGEFRKALTRDNALFAEEKQNLFIDEVRETKQWISAFDNMGLDHSNGRHMDIMGRALDTDDASTIPQSALATWTLEGLVEMDKILWVEDGPLGYISDPAVFASSVRVILAANALIKRARGQAPVRQDITHHLGELLRRSDELRVHPMLLSEINEDPELEEAMLAYNIRPSLLKSKSLVNKTQQ